MSKYANYQCETEYLKDYFAESLKIHGKVNMLGVLDHVSASGMTRYISMYMPLLTDDGKPTVVCIAREKKVTGCGMDMGFHLASNLLFDVYGTYEEIPCLPKLDFHWL